MAQRYVLAVDGGASKTIALVATAPEGQVIGAGRAGNADIYQTPKTEAHVSQAIAVALQSAGLSAGQISTVTLSLVGADWPEDFAHWHSRRAALGFGHVPQACLQVVNDGIGGLEALPIQTPVVAVICGTGAAVSARGASGQYWHSSFWQRTQGAVELAEKALDAVYLAELGIGPDTQLTARALQHFGVETVAELLHRFTARAPSPAPLPIGSFTPLLFATATAGDPVARTLLQHHGQALAGYARTAARQVDLTPEDHITLLLTGGVFQAPEPLLKTRVLQEISAALPNLHLITREVVPVVGAVALALRRDGHVLDTETYARIELSLPATGFFNTTHAHGGPRTDEN